MFNNATGFMEARNNDGSWAGEGAGWTEGDHWAYSLDVMVCLHFTRLGARLLLLLCSAFNPLYPFTFFTPQELWS